MRIKFRMGIDKKNIDKKISQWISGTKQRNKYRSIFNRYYCPTKEELYNKLILTIKQGFKCPICNNKMNWSRYNGHSRCVSLHHIENGFRFVCCGCNTSRGEKDIDFNNKIIFTCAISNIFSKNIKKMKDELNYMPKRKGAFMEDILRFVEYNKDDFYQFLDLSNRYE